MPGLEGTGQGAWNGSEVAIPPAVGKARKQYRESGKTQTCLIHSKEVTWLK